MLSLATSVAHAVAGSAPAEPPGGASRPGVPGRPIAVSVAEPQRLQPAQLGLVVSREARRPSGHAPEAGASATDELHDTFLASSLVATTAPTWGEAHAVNDSIFSIADIRSGRISDVSSTGQFVQEPEDQQQDLAVVIAPTGTLAIVDRSLLAHGAVAAATPSFVDLSWDVYSSMAQYGVSRNSEVIAVLAPGVSQFRDPSVVGGEMYRYNIVPLLDTGSAPDAKMWSIKVGVPRRPAAEEAPAHSLYLQAAAQASARAVAATTTVSWVTFIPQARVGAPRVGCAYGHGYEFGGDGRSFDWRASSFRTAVHAVVTWSTKAVAGHVAMGTTHVYRTSDGRLVSQRTASGSKSYAKKLGSGSNYVDVRLVTHAGNPYCGLTAIDGAFSMTLTRSGNYSIFSGNHRQMPSHHVFIYDGGQVTDVYRLNAASPYCLAGAILCELANFYGNGSF